MHGFTTRQGAQTRKHQRKSLSFPRQCKENSKFEAGWANFFTAIEASDFPLAVLQQKHSSIVYNVERDGKSRELCYQLPCGSNTADLASASHQGNCTGDALVTGSEGILLAVKTADCMPILLVDKKFRTVAAVHAGWRGALGRIIEKTVGDMYRQFGTRPENLVAVVGPSIRGCCYEVGDDVVDAFCGAFPKSDSFFQIPAPDSDRPGLEQRRQTLFMLQAPPGHGPEAPVKAHLDLVAVARSQLQAAGISDSAIYVADYCTACRTDLFFSYRKEGSFAGRMIAAIGILPDKSS